MNRRKSPIPACSVSPAARHADLCAHRSLYLGCFLLAAAGAARLCAAEAMAGQACEAHGSDHYVCGVPSAEDLVHLPGTPWLLAGAYAGGAVLNVIDTVNKSAQVLVPGDTFSEAHDRARFADCPGPIAGQAIATHGLHLAQGPAGALTLYAVGHGAREAIEVFEITARAEALPAVKWIGCVPTPDALEANSVVSLAGGDLLATIPLEAGFEFAQSMAGESTGAVYRWRTDGGAWERLDVTFQPYPNGIATSADETRFYVASSGSRRVTAYTNASVPRELAASDVLEISPDNLHRDASGALVTAGVVSRYTPCNPYNEAGIFELERVAVCPRPYEVLAIDPDTLAVDWRIEGDASPVFSNITMGVAVDGLMWIGSFAADRVAYRVIEH